MKYIGIDPGAYSAVALMEDKQVLEVRSIDVSKLKGGERYHQYITQLSAILKDFQPEVAYCEEPHLQGQANISMCKLFSLIELAVYLCGVKEGVKFMPPQTVKKAIGAIVIHPEVRGVNKEAAILRAKKKKEGLTETETKRLSHLNKRKREIQSETKLSLANAACAEVSNPGIVKALIGQSKWDETDSVAVALAGYRTGGL